MQSRHVVLSAIFAAALVFCGLPAFAHNNSDVFAAVRDVRGQPVRSMLSGQCVLTSWAGSDAECLGMRRGISLEERTVYFEFNKSNLTSEAQGKLDSLAGILHNEQDVQSLSIIGYADRIGSKSYNEALSKRRALSVRDYLIAQGFKNVSVAKVRWFGEDRPSTHCADNLQRAELIACLQPDRRVEVEVNYMKTTRMGHKAKKVVMPMASGKTAPAKAAPKK